MTEPRKLQQNLIIAWCALLALLGMFPDNPSAAPARTWVVGATVIPQSARTPDRYSMY